MANKQPGHRPLQKPVKLPPVAPQQVPEPSYNEPGSYFYAYTHRGAPGTPSAEQSYWTIAPQQYRTVDELPGGSQSWREASQRYAELHPEAVLTVGGKYYRASVPSGVSQALQAAGLTDAQIQTRVNQNALAPIAEQIKMVSGGAGFLPDPIASKIKGDIRKLRTLHGESLFNRQIELGLLPQGSVYISEKEYLTPTAAADLERASPELYGTLVNEGFQAYQTELEKYEHEYQQYLEKQKAFEQQLQTDFPELYQVYKEKGYDGYLAEVERRQASYDSLIATLEPYKAEVPTWAGTVLTEKGEKVLESGMGYDLPKFLRDNPDFDEEKLIKVAGFTPEAIKSASETNKLPWVASNPWEEYFDAFRKTTGGTGWRADPWQVELHTPNEYDKIMSNNPELIKLKDAAYSWKIPQQEKPKLSLESFIDNYLAVRGIQSSNPLADSYRHEAEGVYTSTYGKWETFASSGVKAASYLFTPARVAYPEVELKDITPLEWGVGIAQVALLTVPIIAAPLRVATVGASAATKAGSAAYNAVVYGITGAAGLVFTADTAIHWNQMTLIEKVWAVSLDALIIGSSAIGSLRGIKVKGYSALTGKTIDTSAKIGRKINPQTGNRIKEALEEISRALREKNIKLLRAGARNLELAAGDVPKQLGGDFLAARARLIAANPDEYMSIAKNTPRNVDPYLSSLEGNSRFVRNAEHALRKVKDPIRRAAIEKALKEAKRQVQIATKVKIKPLVQTPEVLRGKYVPQVFSKTTTAIKKKPLLRTAKPTPKTIKKVYVWRESAAPLGIPREAFGRMTYEQIARYYGVEEDTLLWAVSTSPLARTIIQSQLDLLERLKEQEQTSPKIAPKRQAKVQVKPLPATQAKTQLAPYPVLREAIEEKPAPYPAAEEGTAPKFKGETPVKPKKPKTPAKIRIQLEGDNTKRKRIPLGSLTWAGGKLKIKGKLRPVWKYIPPPWKQEKPITLFAPPVGAKNPNSVIPEETIQIIGKPDAEVPKNISIDLGTVDVFVEDYGKTIRFEGEGEKTVVGAGLSSPTKGMSVPGIGSTKFKPSTKRKPKRKRQENSVSTLTGARF